uniref:Uncharacterized protein n=1 Tax=Gorilla gorilla gorilla TaxID=9595 RepID=A0A2I2YXH9_GORGO
MGRDLNAESPLSKAQTAGGFLASFTSSLPTILYFSLHCKLCAKGLSHCYCLSKSPTDSKDRSPAAGCPHR